MTVAQNQSSLKPKSRSYLNSIGIKAPFISINTEATAPPRLQSRRTGPIWPLAPIQNRSRKKAMPVKALLNLVRRTPPRVERVPDGMRVYAIGDIHGRLDLLDLLLAKIAADDERRGDGVETQYIFLGDLIDRGPDSRGVVERVLELSRSQRVVALRGNHEQMMLEGLIGADLFDDFRYCLVDLIGGFVAISFSGVVDGLPCSLADKRLIFRG